MLHDVHIQTTNIYIVFITKLHVKLARVYVNEIKLTYVSPDYITTLSPLQRPNTNHWPGQLIIHDLLHIMADF